MITEDDRFTDVPPSTCPLKGEAVACTRKILEASCNEIRGNLDFFGLPLPVPARLDGVLIPGPEASLNSGLFTAKVNRHAQIPGGPDLYADSVALGHPGRLATVYCGFKAKVKLRPGTHTIVVDYSPIVGDSTVFTYNITVKAHHHSH